VAFSSDGRQVVDGDGNYTTDVFLRDLRIGTNIRVSVAAIGGDANHGSAQPSISGDGQRVAFYSYATNLLAGDTNAAPDVYLRDLSTSPPVTRRVSENAAGQQANGHSEGPSISHDGNLVAFQSIATNLADGDGVGTWDIFVKDLSAGTVRLASPAWYGLRPDGGSTHASISPDGRYVVFRSSATNLVPGDTNGRSDVFVRDLDAGLTELVSVNSAEEQTNAASEVLAGNAISDGGRYTIFESNASNLQAPDTNGLSDVFVRDRVLGTTTRISHSFTGDQLGFDSNAGAISPNGRWVGYQTKAPDVTARDTNSAPDGFVYDLIAGTASRASVTSEGDQGVSSSGPPTSFSRSGRFLAFQSSSRLASPSVGSSDIYLRDVGVAVATAPLNFRVVEATPDSLSLAWDDVATNETSYELERSTTDFETIEQSWTLPEDTTSFLDEGLEAATYYGYRLRAANEAGASFGQEIKPGTLNSYLPDVPEVRSAVDFECYGRELSVSSPLPEFEDCVRENMQEHHVYVAAVNVCIENQNTQLEECFRLVFAAPEDPPPLPNEADPAEPPPVGWKPPPRAGEGEWEWGGEESSGWPTREGSWWRPCTGSPEPKEYLVWDSPHGGSKPDHWDFIDCFGVKWERAFDISRYGNAWAPENSWF
jgi:Tol biopolymer transport system component